MPLKNSLNFDDCESAEGEEGEGRMFQREFFIGGFRESRERVRFLEGQIVMRIRILIK